MLFLRDNGGVGSPRALTVSFVAPLLASLLVDDVAGQRGLCKIRLGQDVDDLVFSRQPLIDGKGLVAAAGRQDTPAVSVACIGESLPGLVLVEPAVAAGPIRDCPLDLFVEDVGELVRR